MRIQRVVYERREGDGVFVFRAGWTRAVYRDGGGVVVVPGGAQTATRTPSGERCRVDTVKKQARLRYGIVASFE